MMTHRYSHICTGQGRQEEGGRGGGFQASPKAPRQQAPRRHARVCRDPSRNAARRLPLRGAGRPRTLRLGGQPRAASVPSSRCAQPRALRSSENARGVPRYALLRGGAISKVWATTSPPPCASKPEALENGPAWPLARSCRSAPRELVGQDDARECLKGLRARRVRPRVPLPRRGRLEVGPKQLQYVRVQPRPAAPPEPLALGQRPVE
jgi:hypothetical protein